MTMSSTKNQFEHFGWRISVEVTRVGVDKDISGFADVHCKGTHRCRISLSIAEPDSVLLTDRLRAKAIGYVEECIEQLSERDQLGIFPAVRGPVEAPSALSRLIYVSRAPKLGDDDLKEILATSRKNNFAREITGALCFLDGVYMQYLEGSRVSVEKLYARIKVDKRHHMPKVLITQAISSQAFKDWSMALLVWNEDTRDVVRGHAKDRDLDLYGVEDEFALPMFFALTRTRSWVAICT